jgi:hypothetical protein
MEKTKEFKIKKADVTINSFVLYGDEAVFVMDDYISRKNRLESLQRLKASKAISISKKLLEDQNTFIQIKESVDERNDIVNQITELEKELNKTDEIKGQTDEETIHLQNMASLPIAEKIKELQEKLKQLNLSLVPMMATDSVHETVSAIPNISIDNLIAEVQSEIGKLENRMIKNILLALGFEETLSSQMTIKEKVKLIEYVIEEEDNDFPFKDDFLG